MNNKLSREKMVTVLGIALGSRSQWDTTAATVEQMTSNLEDRTKAVRAMEIARASSHAIMMQEIDDVLDGQHPLELLLQGLAAYEEFTQS